MSDARRRSLLRPTSAAAARFAMARLAVAVALGAPIVSLSGSVRASNYDAADTTNALGFAPTGTYAIKLSGTGVRIGIFEAEGLVLSTHQEFQLAGGGSIVTEIDSAATYGYTSHGTSVAGVVAGNGVGGSQYRGMAPDVRIRSYDSTSANTKIARDNALLDITNHSYSSGVPDAWTDQTWTVPGVGSVVYETWNYNTNEYRDIYSTDPLFGRYTSTSRSTDATLYDYPKILSFYSAGNTRGSQFKNNRSDGKYVARFSSGVTPAGGVSLGDNYWLVSTTNYTAPGTGALAYDTLAALGTAKNDVVVGSISAYITDPHGSAASPAISSFTNWGPTDDGRLGVTVVGNGASVSTATSTGTNTYTSNISGTSFSSPNVAGTAALVLQHWRNKTGGYTPYSATQKALLIHTATDVVVDGQVGPDYRTGYGIVNALDAVNFIEEATKTDAASRRSHFIESTINRGAQIAYDYAYSGNADLDGDGQLDGILASLVWTDPEGTANSSSSYNDRSFRALVNDLDLWITDTDGTVFRPWTLDPSNPSFAAVRTARNDVDNMEQVWIPAGAFTTGEAFTLHIGIDGTLSTTTQRFSLLLSGGTTLVPEPTTLLGLIGGTMLVVRRRRAGAGA